MLHSKCLLVFRETEWAFGCPEGRQYLVNEANVDRLAVITLNRGHVFKSMDEVKDELSSVVSDFAPANFKVLYMNVIICTRCCNMCESIFPLDTIIF